MESKSIILINVLIAAIGLAAVMTAVFYGGHHRLSASQIQNTNGVPEYVVKKFVTFCERYGKAHLIANQEYATTKLGVYYENYQKIQNHPAESSYKLGENQFMDLTQEEFASMYLGLKVHKKNKKVPKIFSNMKEEEVEEQNLTAVDWREKKAVTPVKDQGQCGSCWSFSTTGSLEGASAIFGSGLQSFSEQQLVDCSTSFGNNGCNGGLMDNAFKYVKKNGITTEDAYPYTAKDGSCKTKDGDFKISKYTDVKKKLFDKTCANLQEAVAQQPVSIGVDAEQWQFYTSGVFDNCGTQLDHGVLAVGYQADGTWIVKNSWNTSWGEDGYIRLKAGNTCGICNTASYPSI